MPSLRLFLLGSPRIECAGEVVAVELRKAVALVVYLALTERSHSRDALAVLFWPEMERRRARAGLRNALAALKKALGEGWAEDQYPLYVDRETVGLNRHADLWLDVAEFQDLLVQCRTHGHLEGQVCADCLPLLTEAASIYHDDFLAGFTLRDCPAFDEWQFFQTEGLRDDLASVLERLACGHSAQGQFDQAIVYARRWLALDLLHEPAHRYLMHLYAWSGQRAAAQRQYDECERILQAELGLPPEVETSNLCRAIRGKRALSPPRDLIVTTSEADVVNNRYRLDAELGQGGMGIVYRAYDLLLERDVALKTWSATMLGTEGHARLLDEAQAVAKLSHPNIVRVYDAGEADGLPFIVMERAEGRRLSEHKLESLEVVLWAARQICLALQHAHEHGIVHRDLKPENVIIAGDSLMEDGCAVKLTDFGLARPVASRITSEGAITGTVYYLAPELALGRRFDGRADLYALGVMLYELTTGSLPFTAGDPLAVISQHLHASVVPPRTKNPEIPPALDALIVHLLGKDPQDRPGSATEVLQALDAEDILAREAAVVQEPSILKQIRRGRLVGREHELQMARSLWSQTLLGQGQVLLVSGEAGVGKTRLTRELVTQARVTGCQALVGANYAEGGVPYAPFIQILRRALDDGLYDRDLSEFVLTALLPLAPALRLRYPGLEPELALDDAASEQQRLFENLVICFTALSERAPLLLVLEDIHWADSGTLALLRHVARQTHHSPVMIIATFRPVGVDDAQPLHEMLLDLGRERLATSLKLRRLDRNQTGEMLAALFAEEITPELLDGIYSETEGNPFFVEEVCKALVESGRVFFEDGRWHRPSVAELGIPQSVRVAILSRVGALPAESQQILLLAAVVGREFDLKTLVEASDQDEAGLIDALEHAERAQLIEELNRAGGGTFSFVHALIPTSLVESMRSLQRRQLHRRVAAAIEARRPEDFEALAHHYHHAGQVAEAVDYLLQAGDRARGLYAQQEAIDHYRRALKVLKKSGDLQRAARTQMKLGLTYHSAFDFQRACRAYQEGFDLWQQAGQGQEMTASSPPAASHLLRVHWNDPKTLDPTKAWDLYSGCVIDQLFSGLVEYSAETGVTPDVARSWEVLEGGCKYVFHLRDDARWVDGTPVTAGDFAYSWRQTLDPANRSANASLLYDIKGARAFCQSERSEPEELGIWARDDVTLVIELERPTGHFPYLLAHHVSFPIPRHVVETTGEAWAASGNLITNGPFQLETWQPGHALALVRNPEYHGRLTGNVQRVELSLRAEPAMQLSRYEAGELDIFNLGSLPLLERDRVQQKHAGEYVSAPSLGTMYLGFDVSRAPFDDLELRRALIYAMDRVHVAGMAMKGYYFPATGGLIPPGMPGHSAEIGLPYDLQLAQDALDRAGYPAGRGLAPLDLLTFQGLAPYAEALVSYWQGSLGIEFEWQAEDYEVFVEKMDRAPPRMFLTGWTADYPDPDNFLRVSPIQRYAKWQNSRYSEAVEAARQTSAQEERLMLYQQADEILIQEAVVMPLAYMRRHLLVKPWIKKLPMSPVKHWFWKEVLIEAH